MAQHIQHISFEGWSVQISKKNGFEHARLSLAIPAHHSVHSEHAQWLSRYEDLTMHNRGASFHIANVQTKRDTFPELDSYAKVYANLCNGC